MHDSPRHILLHYTQLDLYFLVGVKEPRCIVPHCLSQILKVKTLDLCNDMRDNPYLLH